MKRIFPVLGALAVSFLPIVASADLGFTATDIETAVDFSALIGIVGKIVLAVVGVYVAMKAGRLVIAAIR